MCPPPLFYGGGIFLNRHKKILKLKCFSTTRGSMSLILVVGFVVSEII